MGPELIANQELLINTQNGLITSTTNSPKRIVYSQAVFCGKMLARAVTNYPQPWKSKVECRYWN
jgi:hypothetical protein